MKSNIYDQFQLEDTIKTNQNRHPKKNKGTKSKTKIKRIRTELKINIYDHFQLKSKIANIQIFH